MKIKTAKDFLEILSRWKTLSQEGKMIWKKTIVLSLAFSKSKKKEEKTLETVFKGLTITFLRTVYKDGRVVYTITVVHYIRGVIFSNFDLPVNVCRNAEDFFQTIDGLKKKRVEDWSEKIQMLCTGNKVKFIHEVTFGEGI